MSRFEDPVIITCSISGAVANREQCPAIPYTPEEYAAEARRIVDEGGGDTAPACIGDDVQVGQPPQPRARSPREREPDRHAVALREECQARLDDLADLADLPLHVVGDMGLRRHFQLELAPEALDRPGVLGSCHANRLRAMVDARRR